VTRPGTGGGKTPQASACSYNSPDVETPKAIRAALERPGKQHAGSRPAASSSRSSFASALSVLARRFGPRSTEVSAGSATCALTPAARISSATYR
jgi:hypothetical protein